MNKSKQTNYREFLVENKFDQTTIEWSYITPESKNAIEDKIAEIKTFLAEHKDFDNYSEDQKNEYFDTVLNKMYNVELRELIRKADYTFKQTGVEFNFLKDWIKRHNTYDSTTVFYGIHLEATLLARYEKTKFEAEKEYDIVYQGGEPILVYNELCRKSITGLKEDSYIFAAILRKLAECTKIYNHYDDQSGLVYKSIQEWNFGLSDDKVKEFQKAITMDMAKEVIADAQG